MRSMSISGLLLMIIVGGLVLDYPWITGGVFLLAVFGFAAYANGKAHR